jgi:hypothetical protein
LIGSPVKGETAFSEIWKFRGHANGMQDGHRISVNISKNDSLITFKLGYVGLQFFGVIEHRHSIDVRRRTDRRHQTLAGFPSIRELGDPSSISVSPRFRRLLIDTMSQIQSVATNIECRGHQHKKVQLTIKCNRSSRRPRELPSCGCERQRSAAKCRLMRHGLRSFLRVLRMLADFGKITTDCTGVTYNNLTTSR